jgi:hypothetical protein
MKTPILFFAMMMISVMALSQHKSEKLSTEESAKMTQDQRFVHESNRKSNRHHKPSLKKKMKIQKKESRKAKHMHAPKHKVQHKVE